jgi:hypothetical protein
MSSGGSGNRNFQMGVYNNSSNVTGMEWYAGSTGEFFANGVSVDGWHYWVITADGAQALFYRDGQCISGSSIAALGSATGILDIGQDFYNNCFKGKIKAIHVYDRVLSAAEIVDNATFFGITQPSSIATTFTPPITADLLMQIDVNRSGTLWKDAARTQAAVLGDLVLGVTDLSGNNNHWHDGTGAPLGYGTLSSGLTSAKVLRFANTGNKYLLFTNSMSTIRTSYWVVKELLNYGGGYQFLLGHSSAYDFHADTPHGCFASYGNVNLCRVNKVQGAIGMARPTTLQVVTAQNSGNANASEFSRDRGNAYAQSSWVGDIALLLCYSSLHTAQQISDTEDAIKAYLSI